MLQQVRDFFNRPIAEEFTFKNHSRLALQGGVYVFLFVSLMNGSFSHPEQLAVIALVSIGVIVTVLIANVFIPKLIPAFYNEDRWTVGRHAVHTLFILFLISCSNQLILHLLGVKYAGFIQMYFSVTVIGFFPIMLGVFVTEQRRLSRNLAHAQTINQLVAHRSEPVTVTSAVPMAVEEEPDSPVLPKPVVLTSDTGKDRLSIQPDQLLYVESVGNYVDVYWLNLNQPQKTVLRSTLKEVADTLSTFPQFFRCHRAFLVNLKAVNQTEGNARGYQLTLAGTTTKLPVSRSYLEAFDERMAQVD